MAPDRGQRRRDRVALRAYERLLADPASYRNAPSTSAASVLAMVVVAVALSCMVSLVWATAHASGIGWFFVALGWGIVLVVRPRTPRLATSAIVLEPGSYPGLYALVHEMSDAVGVRPPKVIGVDLELNAYVQPVGWRGRSAMVLGVPLLCLGTWHERLGIVGHELGHLRGRDTHRGRLVFTAGWILSGVHYLLSSRSGPVYGWGSGGATGLLEALANVFLAVLALPFLGLAWLLDRLDLASSQHREYLADRRSAEVVGSAALVNGFLRDVDGILTATTSAARRAEDPFAALLARGPLSADQAAAAMMRLSSESARADSAHPLHHLRIKLLQAASLPPSSAMPGEPSWLSAEDDLVRLRDQLRATYSKKLIHGF